MKVWKFKKRIEIDKTIGKFHINTFHYGSFENNKHKTGRNYIVGMSAIANIVRYLGKIEVTRVIVAIAVVIWQRMERIVQKHC